MCNDGLNEESKNKITARINKNYELMEEIKLKLVSRYTKDLDSELDFVKSILDDRSRVISTDELSLIVLELPTLIYFACEGLERLGMKEAVIETIKKDAYNQAHLKAVGTVEIKKSTAETESRQEAIMQTIYKGAYKTLKTKIEAAYELLNAVKKVLNDRTDTYKKEKYNSRYSS